MTLAGDQVLIESVRIPVDLTAHGFSILDVVRPTGSGWTKALADNPITAGVGIVVEVVNANRFVVATHGRVEIIGHGLSNPALYYLSDATAGLLTTDRAGIEQPILAAISNDLLFIIADYGGALRELYDRQGYDEDLTLRQTTSTTFLTAHSFVTPSLPPGDYLIEVGYVWSYDSIFQDAIFRAEIDGVDLINPSGTGIHRQEPADSGGVGPAGTNQRFLTTWKRVVTLTGTSARTIQLQGRSSGGANTIAVYHSYIRYWRIG